MYYEAWCAAVEAGLDLERWDRGEYDRGFMERTIAWHRRRNQIRQHEEDAVSRAMRKERTKGRG